MSKKIKSEWEYALEYLIRNTQFGKAYQEATIKIYENELGKHVAQKMRDKLNEKIK